MRWQHDYGSGPGYDDYQRDYGAGPGYDDYQHDYGSGPGHHRCTYGKDHGYRFRVFGFVHPG